MTLYPVSKTDSEYYQTETFAKIIRYVSAYPRNCKIGENYGKRFVSVEPVNSIDTALNVLNRIAEQGNS